MTDNRLYEELCKIREQYLCRDCTRRFTDCQKMPRLIDADALFKVIAEQEMWNVPDFVYESIQNAPTVEPVRHGRWIKDDTGTEYCSNCHEYPYDDGEYHISNWYSNYCPNCGANMNEEIHDEL